MATEKPVQPAEGHLGSCCPQCGYDVRVDEDGLCATCGCTAVGDGADDALRYRAIAKARPVQPAEIEAIRERAKQAHNGTNLILRDWYAEDCATLLRALDEAARQVEDEDHTWEKAAMEEGRRQEREAMAAELARLRGIEARLKDDDRAITAFSKLRVSVGDMLDDYRRDVLGEEK